MKKLIPLLLILPTLTMATDYKKLYYETQSRLNELETRLHNAREDNVKLVKANKQIEPLSAKVAQYNNYVLDHNLVPDGFRDKFDQYYTLMNNYVSEWENYRRVNLEHRYNSMNFLVLKSYVQENLDEVTFDKNNVVSVNGERLVQ